MEQTSVSHKRIQKTPVIINRRDDEIIHAVYTYRYLTSEQITTLLFSRGSGSYVRPMLKTLAEADYLFRFPLPDTSKGEKRLVYTVASKGLRYLKSLDIDEVFKFRPSRESEVSYQHIHHTLALNDFLIAAQLFVKADPSFSLADMRHEWFLKHHPLSVQLTTGGKKEQITVVPDAYLDFRQTVNGKQQRMPVWVELDRGTEGVKQFKRKIRALLTAIYTKEAEEQFGIKKTAKVKPTDEGTPILTIAFATTANETRLANMRAWVKDELTDMGRIADSSLFLFTRLPQGYLEPKTLFLAPVWYLPDDDKPVSLLDLG